MVLKIHKTLCLNVAKEALLLSRESVRLDKCDDRWGSIRSSIACKYACKLAKQAEHAYRQAEHACSSTPPPELGIG
jgi:hypothetical protein